MMSRRVAFEPSIAAGGDGFGPVGFSLQCKKQRRRGVRRPTSVLAKAFLGAALAATAVSAQQPASAPATDPMADPSAIPMNPSRGARYLIRNAWDYITYQEYERALGFFREAERRQAELTDAERLKLKQGIERAQRGLREAANGASEPSYARSGRLNRPGALSLALPTTSRTPPTPGAPRIEREPIVLATASAVDPRMNPNAANIRASGVGLALPIPLPVPVPVPVRAEVATPTPLPATPDVETAPLPAPAAEPSAPVAETPVVSLASAPSPVPAAVAPPSVPAAEPPTEVTLPEPPASAAALPVPELPPPPQEESLPTLPVEPTQAQAPAPVPSTEPTQAPAPVPIPDPVADRLSEPPPPPTAETLPADNRTSAPAPAPAVDPAAEVEKLPPLPDGMADPTAPAPAPILAPAPEPAPAGAASPAGEPRVVGLADGPTEAAAPVAVAVPDAPPAPLETGPSPAVPAPMPAAVVPSPPVATEVQRQLGADTFIPGPRQAHPSTLTPELQREVERIAQRQDEELKRNPAPGAAPLPGDSEGTMGPGGAASTKLEISRAPSSTEVRPIRAIPVPEEFVPLPKREWEPDRKYWAAAATCHLPLYFQNATLERYGYSMEQRFGRLGRFMSIPLDDPRQSKQRNQIVQPFFSIGLFAAQIALLPYNMIMDPPWEAEYDLGYYRPGDRVPSDITYFPLAGVGPPLRGMNYGLPPRQRPGLPSARW